MSRLSVCGQSNGTEFFPLSFSAVFVKIEENKEEVKMDIHLSNKLDLKLNIERNLSNLNLQTNHLCEPDLKLSKKSLIAPKMKFSLSDILQRA